MTTETAPLPADLEAGDRLPFDPERHIVIRGRVYERDAFSPEQIAAISRINWSDQELANVNQTLQLLQLGRDALVQQLIDSIAEVPFVGVVDSPDAAADTDADGAEG